ncbi:MAG: 30S ribosomal protein S2 [Candidatus Woesearchaeota archaeon]
MTEEQLLVPLDMYLKAGLHIGTKYKSKDMGGFVYKVRSDGLAVFNVQKIDERIGTVAKFLAQFKPEEILVVGRRENSWKAIELFGEVVGAKFFAGRYPPGVLTNPNLDKFIEAKVLIVTDPWPDKNAINDAVKIGIPVIALCDTNNETNYVDIVIPCNNKGKKSLALFFWILAKEYLKSRNVIKSDNDMKHSVDDFTAE